MGQKTIAIIGVLTGCAMLCSLGGCFMSMHKVSFFTGYVFRAVRLETKLLTVDIDDKSSTFSNIINKIRPNTFGPGSHSLDEVYHRVCAPVLVRVYPQACNGFQMAHFVGMMVIGCMFFNALLAIAANWCLYHYITSPNHKAKYRKIAFALMCSGILLVAMSVIIYGVVVFPALDDMRPRGAGLWGELAFKPSQGVGLSWGYFSCALVVVFQMIILMLFPFVRTGEERCHAEIEEAKIAKQMGLEPGYGTNVYDAPGTAGQMPPGAGGDLQFGACLAQPQAQPMAAGGFGQPDYGYAQASLPMQQPMYGAPAGW